MNQRSTGVRARLLTSTIAASAALVATPALAQDEPAATTAEEVADDQSIIVTGTLVRNPNLVASAPVNVVSEEEIELQQANVAEELLRELPGAVPAIGSAVNNGNGGASFVDLRGLGSNRNIVLLDGVRLTPGDLIGRFDLNNIPLALIQRVDVLTGGASTTYGADAVAGVVNFITRQDFAGIDINLSQQITERGDGNIFRGDVVIGANFDDGRGNAVLSVGYQEADAVYQGARDFSIVSIESYLASCVPCGGSGFAVPSVFSFAGAAGVSGSRQIDPALGFAVRPTGTGVYERFNFNPYNILQTPFERFNIYGAARYEISEAIEVYTRAIFSKNTVGTIVAPSGTFGIGVNIPISNPLIPQPLRAQFCANNDFDPATSGVQPLTPAECAAAQAATDPSDPNYREFTTSFSRRAVEVGPRINNFTTTFFDYRAGLRGGITDSIDWDVFGSYGESENLQRIENYTLNSRWRQGLLTTVENGNVVCQDQSNGCVPLNPFGNAGGLTPEMVDFLSESSTVLVRTTLAQARATVSGDFGWSMPWADQPISFAVGGEFREYTATRNSDALSQSGDLGGAGGAAPNIDGAYNVYEALGELIVPIVSNRPFFEELTVEGGIRYSSYNIDTPGGGGATTTTWKVGGSWEPVSGLRFRGNYARSVRAPNIGELFAPVNTLLTNLAVDPCAGTAPLQNQELNAICLAQGAPAFTLGSISQPQAAQVNFTGGGNINLDPETSRSWTVGAVFRPDFIPGLSLSIDYYHITITDAITAPTPQDAIAACFGPNPTTPPAGASQSPNCTQIRRNPQTGELTGDPATTPGLFLTLSNLGRLETSGVDFTANYRRDLGFAGLELSFVGNWAESHKFQSAPGTLNRECVGFYSVSCANSGGAVAGGSLLPEFTFSQRTTLSFGDIDVSLLWRYVHPMRFEPEQFAADLAAAQGFGTGPGEDCEDAAGADPNGCLVDPEFRRIPASHYFDLTTRFAVDDHLTITLGIQNLFDKEPPIVGNTIGSTTFNSGNTFPSTYDTLGRRFVASARLRF